MHFHTNFQCTGRLNKSLDFRKWLLWGLMKTLSSSFHILPHCCQFELFSLVWCYLCPYYIVETKIHTMSECFFYFCVYGSDGHWRKWRNCCWWRARMQLTFHQTEKSVSGSCCWYIQLVNKGGECQLSCQETKESWNWCKGQFYLSCGGGAFTLDVKSVLHENLGGMQY